MSRPQPPPVSAAVLAGLVAFTVVGLVLRCVWVLVLHPPIEFVYSDMASYVDRARHLAAGYYLDTDWLYPPGTPGPIALFMKLSPESWPRWAALMQALLSTAEIPLLFVAARRWFGNGVALATAGCFALHLLSIDYTGLFSSEGYLTFGLILSAALFDPEDPARTGLAGLALGLGALAKPQAMLLGPLWAVTLWRRRQLRSLAALVAGCAALVIPASILCSRATHHFALISAQGGVVLTQAWCPVTKVAASGPGWTISFGLPVVGQRELRGEEESTWGVARYDVSFVDSPFYFREALGCIGRFPGHAARTLVMSLWDTFAGPPWSYQGPWPDAYSAWRTPVLASNFVVSFLIAPLALLAMWRRRRDPGMVALVTLPVLSCVINCMVFHGEPRFRVPYDYALWMAASVAVADWLRSRARSKPGRGMEPH